MVWDSSLIDLSGDTSRELDDSKARTSARLAGALYRSASEWRERSLRAFEIPGGECVKWGPRIKCRLNDPNGVRDKPSGNRKRHPRDCRIPFR